ncbi:phage pre-neck appendage-like protein [[Clostridium] sordellii]|uniref:BppU family phage baseplate upper protein n=1 Tax=Paraclostridium sordellii TaxID=1505 RepID=UPI0005E81FD0|nr:BppU family phage baseplate upper protein [Paeniclostridium sordellii]CEN84156.1 phage pre-neck appendage-like protein [[Clostridium] sordellii] [Paeniclostridium sordellii]CEO09668.1 phage pre-neck appendage-like protein [[Clostridium] sordellii] [Paeniclostridium sordellii]
MLNRKYNLKLDLQFRCNNSNMEFNQFDKNTSDFFMQINRSGKEIDLSKALVTLMVIKPNGNVDSQFLEVGKDGVYANLKPSLKDIPGDYQCKAIVTIKDETVIPDQIFTYTVNEDRFLAAFNSNMTSNEDYDLVTDILGRLSTIETDEQQRQINEAERILSEEARKVAENTRVEAELTREHNDADREKAEATRESNEFNRKTSENSRVEVESNRVEAEKLRVNAETSRVEAEKVRNDNYHFMTSDEERRRNEENARIEAEKLRKQAESTRVNQESQRRTTEQARVLKENERNSNEISREANEVSRKANEEKRVQAETNRSNRYDNFITDAESAANNFKAYISTAKQEEEARKANELARVESEDRRASNEIKRISDENTRKANEDRRLEAETNRQSKFDAKIIEVDNKVIEVNVAKDAVIEDTEKAINTMKEDVANAIAAGTNDLEVKEARKDLKGKTHESLKLRIESDFEGLKESQDMAYSTDKGYLVCKETKNGTIKDLKISGKSLINLCEKRKFTVVGNGSELVGDIGKLSQSIGNGIEYTIIIKVPSDLPSNKCFFRGYDANGAGRANIFDGNELYNNRGRILIKSLQNSPNFDTPVVNVRLFANNDTTDTFSLDDVMIIIGDHTQNPPTGYFEGIASVGNGVDKIEVSSMNNGNILNSELVKAGVNGDTGKLSISSSGSGTVTQQEIIPVVPNMKLYYKSTGERTFRGGGNTFLYKYGVNNDYLGRDTCVTFNPIDIPSNCYGVRVAFTDFELSKDYPADKYGVVFSQFENFIDTPVKQDKKPILFKDVDGSWKPVVELRGLTEVCDTIELHNDGKYYYHQRTEKRIINGGSDDKIFKYENRPLLTTTYAVNVNQIKSKMTILCDKFKYVEWSKFEINNEDSISHVSQNYVYITHKASNTLEEFKQYLATNPVTVIYPLVEEKIFEVNPLFLEAFEGETMMSINSGVVNAPMEFKLTSSLPNLVSLNQKRIKELENQVLTMFKSVLNGDMRTLAETIYPEDFIEENRPML